MSKLNDLILQYCPEGVEYRPLGEVCQKIFAGGTPTSTNSAYYGGDIPWLRSGEVNFNEITSTEKYITEAGYNSSSAKWIEKESVLIAMTGATVARSAMTLIPLTANQSVCALVPNRDILNYRFLYYCISHDYEKIKAAAQGALTSINLNLVKALSIPVPPLPVQEEIVRILDNFSLLSAELEAELEGRRKQYDFYRNQLLSFDSDSDSVQWKKLEEIVSSHCNLSYGIVQPGDDVNGGIPVVRPVDLGKGKIVISTLKRTKKEISDSYKRTILNGDEILLCVRGTTGIMELATEELRGCNVTRGIVPIAVDCQYNVRYIYHILKSDKIQSAIANKTNGAALQQINVKDLRGLVIPIPSLEEQERIANILDRFDTLTNDLSAGLPAEIEARKRQYEHYRDKLLTFKRKDA
ncbi:MAG: restriction endonuclease subunit S [Paludibacteraceae bacterium]|nr:restriction endonuclease subunit S [Paludibacteraceae bacterium]